MTIFVSTNKQKQNKMKKNYSYSVELNFTNKGGDIIDQLINEVDAEAEQLVLTQTINVETSNLHKKILTDFASELNSVLKKIGVEFTKVRQYDRKSTNKYVRYATNCIFKNGWSCVLKIDGVSGGFKESKYTTFTGDYRIRICRSAHPNFCINDSFIGSMLTVEDVLKQIKFDIKSTIEWNKRNRVE